MARKIKRQSYTIYGRDELQGILAMQGGIKEVMDYFPENHGKLLPEEGAWIQIIYPPPTAIYIPYLSVWYAVPKDKGEIKFREFVTEGENGKEETRHVHLAKILTPQGEVCVFPYEYNIISSIYTYLGEHELSKGDVTINWLAPRNDNFDTDLLHYIQSRGIRREDAFKIQLGEAQGQNIFYLTFSRWIQEYFAGTGVPSLQARQVILQHIDTIPHTDEEIAAMAEQERLAEERKKQQEEENKLRQKNLRRHEKMMKNLFGLNRKYRR